MPLPPGGRWKFQFALPGVSGRGGAPRGNCSEANRQQAERDVERMRNFVDRRKAPSAPKQPPNGGGAKPASGRPEAPTALCAAAFMTLTPACATWPSGPEVRSERNWKPNAAVRSGRRPHNSQSMSCRAGIPSTTPPPGRRVATAPPPGNTAPSGPSMVIFVRWQALQPLSKRRPSLTANKSPRLPNGDE